MSKRWGWIFVLVLLVPLEARANAGTPLMWLTGFHLLIGNALIGIGEGLLLSRVYGLQKPPTVMMMILANYVSAWSGSYLIAKVETVFGKSLLGDEPLYRAGTLIALAFAALFAVTVLIEWPFVAYVLRGRSHVMLKALPASLLVQTASYLALAPLFFLASSTGLFTDVRRDASVVQQADDRITVYYIGRNGRDVYRKPLRGGQEERVGTVPTRIRHPVLVPRGNGSDAWALVATDDEDPEGVAEIMVPFFAQTLRTETPPFTVKPPRRSFLRSEDRPPLDCAQDSEWNIRYPSPYDWARSGLTFWNERTGSEYRAAAETPVLSWVAGAATRLPNDQVLFGFLGPKPQVVLLDMPSRRIGLVALGRSPVATIDGAIPAWKYAPRGASVVNCKE